MDLKWLHEFPGMFGIAGILLGAAITGIVSFFANKKWGPLNKAQMEENTLLQDRAIKILEKTIEVERSDKETYRQKLHDCRDTCQAKELKISELEARPDVRSLAVLLDTQTGLLQKMTETLTSRTVIFNEIKEAFQRVELKLEDHDKNFAGKVAEIMRPIQDMCSNVAAMCERVAVSVEKIAVANRNVRSRRIRA